MEKMLAFLNDYVFGPSLPLIIFLCGFLLTVIYGRYIFLHPKKTLSVFGQKNSKDGISPFKSMILALASTLGVGNIVGVSTAIFCGGPGAVFWMLVSAFVAMPLKYGEVFLAVKTRKRKDGEYYGGAPYYIEKITGIRKFGVFFALLLVMNSLTVGNIVQINAVASSFENIFGKQKIYVGLFFALVLFLILKKGTEKITRLTAYLIPVATVFYVGVSLFVFLKEPSGLIYVSKLVFGSVFSKGALPGGVCGYGISAAIRYGVARGIMSNEAGSGTAPTAHAKSNTDSPVKQGIWGIFEVFADTVIMCSMTAYVILLSFEDGVLKNGLSGMELVLYSYEKQLGGFASYVIFFAVFVFAFSTVVCQGVYGREGILYISESKKSERLFVIAFSLCCIFSAVARQGLIWELTDFNVSLMTVLNTVVVMFCSGDIRKGTKLFYKWEKSDPADHNVKKESFAELSRVSSRKQESRRRL